MEALCIHCIIVMLIWSHVTDFNNKMYFIFHSFFLQIYVFMLKADWDRKVARHQDKSPTHCFGLQMVWIARSLPIRSHETRTPSRSPTWLTCAPVFAPPQTAFLGALPGSWCRCRAIRTQMDSMIYNPTSQMMV